MLQRFSGIFGSSTSSFTRALAQVLRFSESHEFVRADGDKGVIGITDFAQSHLGELVFVEVPELGSKFEKNDTVGTLESVKSASDVLAPVSGEVVKINERLTDEPLLVNTSPMDEGWLAEIKLSNVTELEDLMDEAAYAEFCKHEEH
uniref:Glycine cleavage system H protein n=1 Tax=Stygiella incarcerata TaxID=1712417 RepID=A0A192ZIP9_9EUKA|nr:glycine cleavage system H protein [Stygiella incarcerata]|eukprot:TRINITY_DN35263_c0_g1_i1.p1 TRINITY_DN35263_c0_g1~~TRINITY_DN35263_c0_g1_i1.p1  ORF type:complete len:147 (-),score=38.97 TRINITY_DN35263_c0_g1_i1:189-629(-)